MSKLNPSTLIVLTEHLDDLLALGFNRRNFGVLTKFIIELRTSTSLFDLWKGLQLPKGVI